MKFNIRTWFKEMYLGLAGSIAFYPAIIVSIFLGLSLLSITFDFSEEGKALKSHLQWLRLKDPSTARSIIASIASGIISLTVFSFSMVMIVLNQTASQMSNRILDKLIGSRFQQIVLGVYVGTIIYALFLLSTIRDVDSGIHIPSLSTYLLIGLTICDIFLFIYFLHYITQSVKYDVIIDRIFRETIESIRLSCNIANGKMGAKPSIPEGSIILSDKSGIYEGFNTRTMIDLCRRHNCIVKILYFPGSFILKGIPVAKFSTVLSQDSHKEFQSELLIHARETIRGNFFYGFRQLTEVGLKALSPGVNDPGTAIQVMRALFDLYTYSIVHSAIELIVDDDGELRIVRNEHTFEEMFAQTILPIWDYGKVDRMIQTDLQSLLVQLLKLSPNSKVADLLEAVNLAIRGRSM